MWQICHKQKSKFLQALAVPQFRDDNAINILAKNVRKYRTERKMTMEVLAAETNIEYSQISRIERGLLNTSISVIFAIARSLQVEPGKLLEA